jgi:hypothetical protein
MAVPKGCVLLGLLCSLEVFTIADVYMLSHLILFVKIIFYHHITVVLG